MYTNRSWGIWLGIAFVLTLVSGQLPGQFKKPYGVTPVQSFNVASASITSPPANGIKYMAAASSSGGFAAGRIALYHFNDQLEIFDTTQSPRAINATPVIGTPFSFLSQSNLGSPAQGMAAGDIDGDNYEEIVLNCRKLPNTLSSSSGVHIIPGTPPSTPNNFGLGYDPGPYTATLFNPQTIQVVDVGGGSIRKEIVYLVGGTNPQVRVLTTTGSTYPNTLVVSHAASVSPAAGAQVLHVADVNGDNRKDIIVGGQSRLEVFLNTSSNMGSNPPITFAAASTPAFTTSTLSSGFTNVNAIDIDGVPSPTLMYLTYEIVASDNGNMNVYDASTGTPTLLTQNPYPGGGPGAGVTFDAMDLTGTGLGDIALVDGSNPQNPQVTFWTTYDPPLSTFPSQGLLPEPPLPIAQAAYYVLSHGDVDGDGNTDVVIGQGSLVSVFYNKTPVTAWALTRAYGCPQATSVTMNPPVIGSSSFVTVNCMLTGYASASVDMFLTPNLPDCGSIVLPPCGQVVWCSPSYVTANFAASNVTAGLSLTGGLLTVGFAVPNIPLQLPAILRQAVIQPVIGASTGAGFVADAVTFEIGL